MTTRLFFLLTIMTFALSCHLDDSKIAKEQNQRGLDLLNNGQENEARLYYIKASEYKNISDSDRTNYLENVATSYLHTPHKDSAKYYYLKAALLNPINSYYYKTEMANIHLIDSKIDSALYLLEEAFVLDSTKPIVNNLLGLIYMGEYGRDYFNPQKAIKYNRKTFELLTDATSKFALAKNEYLVNNTEKSAQMFSELHKNVPNYEPYLVSLILIKGEQGDSPIVNKLLLELKQLNFKKYNAIKEQIRPGEHSIQWNP